jgi:hypothetical protein
LAFSYCGGAFLATCGAMATEERAENMRRIFFTEIMMRKRHVGQALSN